MVTVVAGGVLTAMILIVLIGFVEPLYTLKSAEARNLVTFLFTVYKQHNGIHAVILTSGKIAGPLQRSFREPGLSPILTDTLDFLNHHFSEEV